MPSSSDIAGPRARRLTHVNLFVGDLARSAAFYEDVCGLSMVFDEAGIKAKFLSNGNSHHDVALMQATNEELVGRDGQVQKSATRGARPGLNHLGFEMHSEAELIRTIERIEAAGAPIARMLDHQISHSVYLSDPDGIDIELYADTTPDWREVYRQAEGHLLSSRWTPDGGGDELPHYVVDYEFRPPARSPVAPLRTERAAIGVRDLDASLAFYETVVGLEATDIDLAGRRAVLRGSEGSPHVVVTEVAADAATGFRGFGLRVEDEAALERAARELRARGVTLEHAVAVLGEASILLVDPDGVRVELFARTSVGAAA